MKNKLHTYSAIFLLLIAGCRSTENLGRLQEGQWEAITTADGSHPEKRHEAGFVEIDGQFLLLGGRGMKPTNIYDPVTNTWAEGAVPPIELHHFQPLVYKGEAYIIGAMTGKYPGEVPIPDIYIYNPKQDEWRKGPEIPAERRRGAAGAVLYGDKIYLVCGIVDGHRGGHQPWLDAFSPETGEWIILPDAPRPRDHFHAVVVGGNLYAIAGRTTTAAEGPMKNTIPEVDVFSFETRQWRTLPDPLPTLRAGNFALATGKWILVMGGESATQESAHAEVEALDTRSGTWHVLPPLNQPRHGTGAVWWRQNIYTASGSAKQGGGPELEDIVRYSY